MDYRVAAPNLALMHNAGMIQIPGLPAQVNAVAEAGLFDTDTLAKILRFYEQNKDLAKFLIGLFRGDGKPPEVKPAPAPIPIPPPPAGPPPSVIVPPPASAAREIASLGLRYFWAERKNTPYKEGGGRKMIEGQKLQSILTGADPWQAGDRVCFDCTPEDQFGRKFMPGDPANILMREIEYVVIGDGELQTQDPTGLGFDPTPVIFVPWEPASGVKPGYQGELGLVARYHGIEARTPLTRIRPWAA
jgi:hypothetical protein